VDQTSIGTLTTPVKAPCVLNVDCGFGATYTQGNDAGVTQLVEYLLPKQAVAGSSPVPRSHKTLQSRQN
jgi:hypothetical protein